MVDAAGLKPAFEGSIPSFLALGRRRVPQMYGMEVGSRGFIRRLL